MTTLLVTSIGAGIGAASARFGASRIYDHGVVNCSRDGTRAKAVVANVERARDKTCTIWADMFLQQAADDP